MPPVKIPLGVSFLNGFPFVIKVLALCQCDLDFDFTVEKIDLKRNQGEPLFVDFAVKLFDFPAVKQKFSNPKRIMVSVVGKGIHADMHLMEKNLSVLDLGIRIFDVDLAVTNGFDLGTFQNNPSLILIFDEIIKAGFSVVGNDFFML